MSRYLQYSVIYRQHIKVLAGGGAGESGFFQEAGSPASFSSLPFLAGFRSPIRPPTYKNVTQYAYTFVIPA
jgi:hypothetical protein